MKWIKNQIRKKILAQRVNLDGSEQTRCEKRIADQLFSSAFFQQSSTIAVYHPFGGEVPTAFIIKKIQTQQKQVYLPVLTNNATLTFIKLTAQTQLIKNRYGILEPVMDLTQHISPRSLDLVLVPLVAFDRFCHRLGMGKGYYDATFAFKRVQHRPWLVGIAYEFQKVLYVPHTNLDVKLDAVLTEKTRYGDKPLSTMRNG